MLACWFTLAIAAAAAGFAAATSSGSISAAAPPLFHPGAAMADTDGTMIRAHQPHVYVEGGKYYLVGSAHVGASDGTPGIVNLYTSDDLHAWTLVGAIYNHTADSRPSLLGRNPRTHKYVLWAKGNSFQVATASSLQGPYSTVGNFRPSESCSAGDSASFLDPVSGKAYVVYSQHTCGGENARAMMLLQLNDDWTAPAAKPAGEPVATLPGHLEAPCPFYSVLTSSWYIWTSHTSGWRPNAAELLVSTQGMSGPWRSLGNPSNNKSTFDTQGSHIMKLPIAYAPNPRGGTVERFLYVGDRYEPYINTTEGSRYIFLALEVHSNGEVVLKPPVPWGLNDWPAGHRRLKHDDQAASAIAAAAADSSLAAPPPPCPGYGAAGTLGKYCTPKWPPTYSMPKSTIVMPCNSSGFLDPAFAAQWGICDIDWSNLKQQWDKDNPMDCSQLLIEQARRIKAVDNTTHVFVYRNLVKALPWYEQVAEKLADERYSGFFLPFRDGIHGSYTSPPCSHGLCSPLYHSQDQVPAHANFANGSCGVGVPCGEYLFDHRNESLRRWLVDNFVLGPLGIGSDLVSGMYLDDGWTNGTHSSSSAAPGHNNNNNPFNRKSERAWNASDFCSHSPIGGAEEMNYNCSVDMGLTQADTTAIKLGWMQTNQAAMDAMHDAGGWDWHAFAQFTKGAPPQGEACIKFFHRECASNSKFQRAAVMMEFTDAKTAPPLKAPRVDIATFLLARGDYAWLGYGWQGCVGGNASVGGTDGKWPRPALLEKDYGQPIGLCKEVTNGSGVFERTWTRSHIQLDCNSYEATFKFHDESEKP
eukprot:COSAG05_NODE_678_length_7984_cov_3.957134_3_plen_811_part_00